ncbi:hypothetical protein [Anaplasma platys]|uniref:hypothetical protein n=1 Tax=Anaplasma platys TaxID=949 RepID=UPI001F440C41|nr:hypothetical protein [Anaplasma platys]
MTAVLGSVFSTAIIVVSKYAFTAWGWRIPFVAGFVLSIASVFMRAQTGESPVYEKHKAEDQEVTKAPSSAALVPLLQKAPFDRCMHQLCRVLLFPYSHGVFLKLC